MSILISVFSRHCAFCLCGLLVVACCNDACGGGPPSEDGAPSGDHAKVAAELPAANASGDDRSAEAADQPAPANRLNTDDGEVVSEDAAGESPRRPSEASESPETEKPQDEPVAESRPLQSLVAEADQILQRYDEEVEQYSCLLIKRERIDDKLTPYHFIWMKVRERQVGASGGEIPFAVYLKFLKPASVAGREVLYVEGERSGDMLVRKGGTITPYVTLRIDPQGDRARQESQHPVTESGMRYMIEELKQRLEMEIDQPDCQVKEYQDAKFNGRPCRHVVVQQQKKHPDLDFSSARVFVDKEWGFPVYYAAYGWPDTAGEEPPLLEEFLFTRITLNPPFTEADFQEENRDYGFRIDE